jgi:signal transduction histidine kinase
LQKYRLTLLFLAISAVTIGLAAVVINVLSARAAEQNLVRFAREQADRDTKLAVGIVRDVLSRYEEEQPVSGVQASPGESARLALNGPAYREMLNALDIVDVRLYDLSGSAIWKPDGAQTVLAPPEPALFSAATAGEVSSSIRRNEAGSGQDGPPAGSAFVETYIPIIDSSSGQPVAVLGVYRDVTASFEEESGEIRSGFLRATLFGLGGVFVILLGFVLVADARIWKATSTAIAKERDEVSRLGETAQDLQRLNEAKSRFLSMVSHELTNPLTGMISFLDLALRNKGGTLHERDLRLIQTARQNARHLERLISDLVDLSRSERGALTITRADFDARSWLEEVVQSALPTLGLKSQRLRAELPAPGTPIWADRDRLTQVALNLISNASKYSPKDTQVDLTATVNSGRLTVTLVDHGVGMSREEQRNLFTLFYRADNAATRAVGGSGIGLAIAREIVRLHGGEIFVASKEDAGTTVTFWVPAAKAAAHGTAGPGTEQLAA